MSPQDLRIGDAERDAAAKELGEHFAQGRLDSEEYAERLDAVMSAKTAGQLRPAFTDLPRVGADGSARRAAVAGPRRWGGRIQDLPRVPRLPFLFKVLVGIVLVTLAFSHLPLLVIALLVYVLAIRRVGRRRRRTDWMQGWHGHAHWH